MKCEEFHSSKTIEYGKDLLQRRVDEGVIDEKEQKLLLQFLESRIGECRSFGGAKYVEYVSGLTHFRRAGYLQVPWYAASNQELIGAIADYKKLPIRQFTRDGRMRILNHGYADNTLNTDLRAVVTWLFWLSDSGIIQMTRQEIQKIKIPTYKPKKLRKESIYSEQMISKLVEPADTMMRAMVWTHYETGCRSNELCGLNWQDIEWRDKAACVHIHDTKTDKERSAFVSMHSVSYLRQWMEMYPGIPKGDNPVFINDIQTRMLYSVYLRDLKKLQFKYVNGKRVRRMPEFSPHDLRRWRATNLFRQGVSRSTVCNQLWGTTKTTYDSVYSQFNEEDAYSEMEVIYGIKDKTDIQKPLPPNYCPICGKLNPAGQRFCGSCGFALQEDAQKDVTVVETAVAMSPQYMTMVQQYIRDEVRKAVEGR